MSPEHHFNIFGPYGHVGKHLRTSRLPSPEKPVRCLFVGAVGGGLVEVRIERLEKTQVAVQYHEGPYEGLADVIGSLVRWLKHHKKSGGAVTTVFLDPQGLEAGVPAPPQENAGETGEAAEPTHDEGPAIQAEVWVPWDQPSLPEGDEGELTLKTSPAAQAACVTYTGHPLGIPQLALALRSFLETQGHPPRPETRIVHLMPDWENPEDWVAEVQVPLEPDSE